MAASKNELTRHLWYVRQDDEVEGPFPAKLISRRILVGRIRMHDEVSVDQFQWQTVESLPDLIPDVMAADPRDAHAQERLAAAVRWADERTRRDRRNTASYGAATEGGSRGGQDRRQLEGVENVNYRETRAEGRESEQRESQYARLRGKRIRFWKTGAFILVVVAAVALSLFIVPRPAKDVLPDCGGAPRPNVNWSSCQLEGSYLPQTSLVQANLRNANLSGATLVGSVLKRADLAYSSLAMADLRYADVSEASMTGVNLRRANLANADLRGADLSYANLTEAVLRGAKLGGARLDKAIWIDGRVCAPGSLGECSAPSN